MQAAPNEPTGLEGCHAIIARALAQLMALMLVPARAEVAVRSRAHRW